MASQGDPKIDLRTSKFDECFEKPIQTVFSQRVSLNVMVSRKRELPLDFDECFTFLGVWLCMCTELCEQIVLRFAEKGWTAARRSVPGLRRSPPGLPESLIFLEFFGLSGCGSPQNLGAVQISQKMASQSDPKIDLRTPKFDECFTKSIQAVFSQRFVVASWITEKESNP